jgi:uncharacterized zinc-type alcohol dehydrogenase-like protein
MANTKAVLVATPGAKFEKGEVPLRDLGPEMVAISIKYSGICHSDIHQAKDEWFEGIFPMGPGHEIVGEVTAVGSNVKKFSVGDRVGVGTFVDSCRKCEPCRNGQENFCRTGNVQTYNGRHYDGEPSYGGYAKDVVVDQNYVLSVPGNIDFAASAPLLCAGITVYTPLKHWGVKPGMRVGVIGLGGLGHMAVKFAVAMGAEVYVLGRSKSKLDDAQQMGAKDYLITAEIYDSHQNFFDLLLNTTSADLDLDNLLGTLKVAGSLVYLGLSGTPQSFNAMNLVTSLRSISGINTGNIADTQEMLDFCGENNIVSQIELLDVSEASAVDRAYERVINSDVRYRFVIDAATI